MAANNAFWREVIDYLPNLILVFRVNEEEEAQLIFCNNKIKDELGYSAREFVLASESEGKVKQEVDALIDEVAQRSHDVEHIPARLCTLTHKQGEEKSYEIDFRLFRTKKGNAQLIAVELRNRSRMQAQQEDNQLAHSAQDDLQPKGSTKERFVVYESEIMQSVLETVQRIERESRRHILFRGEAGTGKRTLVDRIINRQTGEGGDWHCWNIDVKEGTLDEHSVEKYYSQENKLILRIPHISILTHESQQQLLDLLRKREREGMQTWLLATTTKNLEEQVSREDFLPQLYYLIGFETVLIPPLRHRPEDIRAAAEHYIRRAGDVLNLHIGELDEESICTLTEQKWDKNFPELFRVLRRSLLESEEGNFELRLKQKQQYQLFPEQKISEDAVLSFDQMNRTYLERVLELTDGKIYGDDGAAELLDLKPTTLQSKLKRLGIK